MHVLLSPAGGVLGVPGVSNKPALQRVGRNNVTASQHELCSLAYGAVFIFVFTVPCCGAGCPAAELGAGRGHGTGG